MRQRIRGAGSPIAQSETVRHADGTASVEFDGRRARTAVRRPRPPSSRPAACRSRDARFGVGARRSTTDHLLGQLGAVGKGTRKPFPANGIGRRSGRRDRPTAPATVTLRGRRSSRVVGLVVGSPVRSRIARRHRAARKPAAPPHAAGDRPHQPDLFEERGQRCEADDLGFAAVRAAPCEPGAPRGRRVRRGGRGPCW